jgi:hypothetical protein
LEQKFLIQARIGDLRTDLSLIGKESPAKRSSGPEVRGSSSCSPTTLASNPIEKAFVKLKAHPRTKAIRTIDALSQEIGSVWTEKPKLFK